MRFPLIFLFLVCSFTAGDAKLSLSSTVGSSMVIQGEVPTPTLWGWATAGATVTTTLVSSGASYLSIAGADGVWRCALPAQPMSTTPQTITFNSSAAADEPLSITDIVFGSVIICSGQSNQALSIEMALNATQEVPAIDAFGPYIRILKVNGQSSAVPSMDLAGADPWARVSSAGMNQSGFSGFSATCWFFGRDMFLSPARARAPVGLILSCVGGTAIRQWSPTAALARCPQPYTSPIPYGTAPYAHSEHYNAMIYPFTSGPTTLQAVVYDQAESDSFPQTPIDYYGCATVAQINAWRAALRAPLLPWLFVHLQPYTGSGPCCLEQLRSAQLAALALPAVGYASAMDLGDLDSTFGNVHFRNKQTIAARLVEAALVLLRGSAAPSDVYPPPSFFAQQSFLGPGGLAEIDVSFAGGGSGGALALIEGVTCPPSISPANCSAFSLIGNDTVLYAANASLSEDGATLTLSASLPPNTYAAGSVYGWSMWPVVSLYAGAPGDGPLSGALPVLPWSQGLMLPGPPGPRPALVHYSYGTLCLSTNSSFPCTGGASTESVRHPPAPPVFVQHTPERASAGNCSF